jgi:hypothetical protein
MRSIRGRRYSSALSLLLVSIPLHAQINKAWPKHDPDLIEKLYRGDFAHISDDNFGRIDLEAVMTAFRSDAKLGNDKCPLFGGETVTADQMAKIATYIRYLNSNSTTGEFPSAQFMALSALGPDAFALDPNMMAMGLEIGKSGCRSNRVQKIRENIVDLLDQRIEWHSKDQSPNIKMMKQTVMKVSAQTYRSTVLNDVAIPAQEPVLRQIADLEARGAQLVQCEYGPTNPDSTGSQTMTFWYGNVPLTMADFQKLSRKHPLGDFGDMSVNACPQNLAAAKLAFWNSRQVGINKLDQNALAPATIPLDRVMGQLYPVYQQTRNAWISYQTTHDPRDQQQASAGKSQLLKSYGQSCDMANKAGVRGSNNIMCLIFQQLSDEFQPIPELPQTGSRANAPGPMVPAPARPGRPSTAVPAANGNTVSPSSPDVAHSSEIPVGTVLLVATLEPIDLLSADPSRLYRGQLERPAVFRGTTVLPQGTEVLLKITRQNPPAFPNAPLTFMVRADSTTFNGKSTPLVTNGSPLMIPAGPQQQQFAQLPAGRRFNLIVQPPRN